MVRAVLVAPRHPQVPNRLDAYCNLLNRKLTGDNIEPRAPTLVRRDGVAVGLLNPNGAVRMQGASIAMGMLLDADHDWHVPRAGVPDGSFALLRVDQAYIELVADSVASRTLWYALTDDEFIVSSSQRAIVTLLGSYEPNREVLPWMLSSGTLGPTGGWDVRLKRVQPGERVLLDRARWRSQSTFEPLEFVADRQLSHAAHLEHLSAAVGDACRRWSFDARRWVLTLSGGADSRSLLCALRDRGIGTVTWGLPNTGEQDSNDAQIAREVARSLDVPHRFFALEPRGDTPDVILERFLAVGEGRVDRLSGYIDGFRVWQTLFDDGYHGVIRGDQAFTKVVVQSEYAARFVTSLATLADYFSAKELAALELPEQALPARLTRAPGETLATWRDRLYQQSRVPTFLAALTDLKTAYLEVGSPLLARSVLECVRAVPDELRAEKRLWLELVGQQLPEIALAKRVAISSVADFLRDRRVLELLLDELSSERTATLFTPPLLKRCRTALHAAFRVTGTAHRRDWRQSAIGRAVPARLRAAARNWRANRPSIEPQILAFRAFIAARMQAQLGIDAATRPVRLEPAVNA